MKTIWFKRFGGIYIPVTFMGLAITILTITFLIPVYATIITNGHSLYDDLYHLFVYTTCTFFWWKWIAEKTSN